MSDNKFIKHLRGEDTAKSVLEIKNQRTTTSFANMPDGNTSNANDVYSDRRGDAAGVLKGTENWKLDGQNLVEATTVYGDGRDFTDSFSVFGNSLWVDASFTFTAPKLFAPNTKFVLKLCGHDLETVINHTVDFTLIVKFSVSNLISKTFTVTEQAFDFCKEFVIDFAESNLSTIKADTGSTMQVQLLCADPAAQAVLYNGMTVFTVLQRRVDGDTVASDTKTFEELEEISDAHISNKNNPHEVTKAQVGLGNCDNTSDLDKPISTATQTALDGKVNDTGDTLTGMYKHEYGSRTRYMAANSTTKYADVFMNGDEFEILFHTSNSIYDGLYGRATNGYVTLYPGTDNQAWLGLGSRRWNRIFVTQLCPDTTSVLTLPNETGILATKGDVDLAANSGDQLTEKGVWYAKMYSATVAPSAEDGTNYADFSQTDDQGNPIIVIYKRQNGAWVQDQTITPPAEYNGYVPVTRKIWDIVEQAGQQGGKVLWSHSQKTFTPSPLIISFEDIEVTGDSTVIMPQNPGTNQIVNKDYVDEAIAEIPTGGAGHNVGDVFFTMRKDTALNGAVECNGATYNTTDFTGAESIGNMLALNKIPYVSLATYQTLLNTQGSVGVFGWDGVGTTAFRVPSLEDIFVESGTSAEIGDYLAPKIPNIKGYVTMITSKGQPASSGALYSSGFYYENLDDTGGNDDGNSTINIDASRSSGIYDDTATTVQPNAVRYRAMVQLAVSATDEAVETCTGVLADVSGLKDASNLTSTGQANIIGLLMPDYSQGINVALTGITQWTAPIDCFVSYQSGLKNGAQEMLYIGNVRVFLAEGADSGMTRSSFGFYMKAGQILTGLEPNDINRNSTIYYFPLGA